VVPLGQVFGADGYRNQFGLFPVVVFLLFGFSVDFNSKPIQNKSGTCLNASVMFSASILHVETVKSTVQSTS